MNKIKKEIDKIELPEELSQRSRTGVQKARESMNSRKIPQPRNSETPETQGINEEEPRQEKRKFRYASFLGGLAASLLLLAVIVTGIMPTGGPLELLRGFRAVGESPDESDLASLEIVDGFGEDFQEELPVVGSREKLRELTGFAVDRDRKAFEDDAGTGDFQPAFENGSSELDYSSTNLQVQGVDESDIIKTDGEYIYQISGNQVVVSRVFPIDNMEVIKRIPLEEGIFPLQLYVDSNHLVVLGVKQHAHSGDDPTLEDFKVSCNPLLSHLKVLVFDITNKSEILKTREIEVEGHYVSSRKIGPTLYLVTNKRLDSCVIQEKPGVFYRDTAREEGTGEIFLDQIRYFPGVSYKNYLIITSFDLDRPEQPASVEAFLSSGENVYMSRESLYIAVGGWEHQGRHDFQENTAVFAFDVKGPRVEYRNRGEVPGNIINQFSIDEYGGYFRIATTTWEEDSKNHLFVLDRSMNVVGSVNNIAPGERIYSARFIGNRAYLVTFEVIDPLFVIDLEVPHSPRILGELKIPGFSTYLHPLDEDHLLGIGRDTAVTQYQGRDLAEELGIKLAIFDVSDAARPVERHMEIIGGRGTMSEVLHNHKALMFKEGLMAFPLMVVESGNYRDYGNFDFQGAYVYRVDVKEGFDFLGGITHLEGTPEFYYTEGVYEKNVERVFSIEGVIYTVSRDYIMAHRLEDLERVGLLNFNY